MLLRWDDPFGASMLATLLILCLLFQLYCKVSLTWHFYVKLMLSVLCLFHTMQSIYRSINHLCNLSIDPSIIYEIYLSIIIQVKEAIISSPSVI
jgi:hypothetical protein